jgi:hypothetical protein
MGTYTLDVATSSTGTNTTGTPQPTQTDTSANAQAWEPYQKKIIAHAVLASVGFLVLLPSGALLGRLGRTFTPWWFQGHWILNFALSTCRIDRTETSSHLDDSCTDYRCRCHVSSRLHGRG